LGERVTLSLRPEKVGLRPDGDPGADLSGTIQSLVYFGTDTQYRIDIGGGRSVLARVQNAQGARPAFAPGARVALQVAPGAAQVLAD
jgi:spermidine/putrescine transport system ATP-binding protein